MKDMIQAQLLVYSSAFKEVFVEIVNYEL